MEGKKDLRRLPESELDIMLCIWNESGEYVTAPELSAKLEKPLTASAFHSYLNRLEEKGFIQCDRAHRPIRVKAQVSREDYRKRESRTILGKLYDNSLKRFTAALYDGGAVSQQDLEELRDYLEELGKGDAK